MLRGGAGLRNFTGFRESRPTAGLQVIVPFKLGLKNILIGINAEPVDIFLGEE